MSTKIAWTEETWNPSTGCSKVSPGCARCYAERLSLRFGWSKLPWTPEHAAENVILHPERLDIPLRWRKPKMVFVNSMSDLFHEQVPDEFIGQVFTVMVRSPQHTFQVLTKRPERMQTYLRRFLFPDDPRFRPAHNIWLGISAENQHWYEYRWRYLEQIPASIRFVSLEPLLGSIDLQDGPLEWLPDWVITGGESGLKARPMKIEWLEAIVEQCRAANVPVFVKQASGPRPGQWGQIPERLRIREWPR